MMNKELLMCPICEEGQLHDCTGETEAEYKGNTRTLPLYYSECDCCGSEQASAAQTRDNKRAMVAFKKEVDGFLTGAEIKKLRAAIGVNQKQAASIFGGGPVAFSKYEADDVTQSDPMDKLLRLAKAVPEALAWLKKQAQVDSRISKPRAAFSQKEFAIMGNGATQSGNIVCMEEWKTRVEPWSGGDNPLCQQMG